MLLSPSLDSYLLIRKKIPASISIHFTYLKGQITKPRNYNPWIICNVMFSVEGRSQPTAGLSMSLWPPAINGKRTPHAAFLDRNVKKHGRKLHMNFHNKDVRV